MREQRGGEGAGVVVGGGVGRGELCLDCRS